MVRTFGRYLRSFLSAEGGVGEEIGTLQAWREFATNVSQGSVLLCDARRREP